MATGLSWKALLRIHFLSNALMCERSPSVSKVDENGISIAPQSSGQGERQTEQFYRSSETYPTDHSSDMRFHQHSVSACDHLLVSEAEDNLSASLDHATDRERYVQGDVVLHPGTRDPHQESSYTPQPLPDRRVLSLGWN